MPAKFQQIIAILALLKSKHTSTIVGEGAPLSSISFSYKWHRDCEPIVLLIYVGLKSDISIKINWCSYGAMSLKISKRFSKAMSEAVDIAKQIDDIIEQPAEIATA